MIGADKRVAIVQSSYIPWKGYFDLINLCDLFVLYDSAQYTRRDWRNRNRIKSPSGLHWLTIPVKSKGRFLQRVDETELQDRGFGRRHWSAVQQAYGHTEHFGHYREPLEELFLGSAGETMLSHVNERFIRGLCELLGIATPMVRLPDSALQGPDPVARLVSACRHVGATEYLSGPTARSYMNEEPFTQAGIDVSWMDYSAYPEYPQPFPPFEHGVSVIDLLLCVGPAAPAHMKSFPQRRAGLAEAAL